MDALLERGITPDIVTDQTTTDPIRGYIPRGMTAPEADELRGARPRRADPARRRHADRPHPRHARVPAPRRRGVRVRQRPARARRRCSASTDAFDMGVFTERYIRPLFCQGIGPFRWLAISGNPDDIYAVDDIILEHFAGEPITHWITAAREAVQFTGLPGAHRLARLRRPPQARPARQRRGRERPHHGPDRVHARPPRLGLGGRPGARDGAHARRLRRHRRLADPERAAQHRLARRPRGRARLRRPGAVGRRDDRRRRHRAGRRAARRRARQRSRASACCATRTPATKPQSRRPRRPGWDSSHGDRPGRRPRPRRGRRGTRQRLDAAGPLVLRSGRRRARARADLRAQLDAALPRGQARLAGRPRRRQVGPRAGAWSRATPRASCTASSTSAATAPTRWR